MRLGFRRTFLGAAGMTIAWLSGAALAGGQAAPEQRPQMAEEVFKNVQVLKGIPVNQFMGTMGVFSAALGMSCEDCHSASDRNWEQYALDNPRKRTARRMVLMMAEINRANFGGRQVVTCYTCHRSSDRPTVTPDLSTLYTARLAENPDILAQAPGAPPPDQVLDKYVQALGGAQALSRLTSFTGKGTYEGFDSDFGKVAVDIYAKAPDLRTMVVHMASGDATSMYNGREAWLAYPRDLAPLPLIPLVGADIAGARLDAQLAFPAGIKQLATGWRADFPAVTIDDKPVFVVQGTIDRNPVKLYFDKTSGLLVRQTRYAPTAVGTVPTHVTYSDYRELPGVGVKVPFTWQMTWVDGQYTVNLMSVQPNVAIDAARFAKPAPPR